MSSSDGRVYGMAAVTETSAKAARTSTVATSAEKVWKSGMYEKVTSMTFWITSFCASMYSFLYSSYSDDGVRKSLVSKTPPIFTLSRQW